MEGDPTTPEEKHSPNRCPDYEGIATFWEPVPCLIFVFSFVRIDALTTKGLRRHALPCQA